MFDPINPAPPVTSNMTPGLPSPNINPVASAAANSLGDPGDPDF
jgi:hypothetical protein